MCLVKTLIIAFKAALVATRFVFFSAHCSQHTFISTTAWSGKLQQQTSLTKTGSLRAPGIESVMETIPIDTGADFCE